MLTEITITKDLLEIMCISTPNLFFYATVVVMCPVSMVLWVYGPV